MASLQTPKDVLDFVKSENVEVVDLRFMDFPGLWQHFSIPTSELNEGVFDSGLGFDGSSIRGWQQINESDMLVKPVAASAFVDPFCAAKTLVMICNICDPVTGADYTRDQDGQVVRTNLAGLEQFVGVYAIVGSTVIMHAIIVQCYREDRRLIG